MKRLLLIALILVSTVVGAQNVTNSLNGRFASDTDTIELFASDLTVVYSPHDVNQEIVTHIIESVENKKGKTVVTTNNKLVFVFIAHDYHEGVWIGSEDVDENGFTTLEGKTYSRVKNHHTYGANR